MLAKLISAALVGFDACLIGVEVEIAGGLPRVSVVGLPDATVCESRDRVRSRLSFSRKTHHGQPRPSRNQERGIQP